MVIAQTLKRENPFWNTQAVSYRFTYLAGKITDLTAKVSAAAAAAGARRG